MVGVKKVFSVNKGEEINGEEKTPNKIMIVFVGIVEILGAIGLILPWLLDIAPILTPLAAIGIAIIMVLAAIYHGKRKESIVVNIIILVLALFVAIGRLF